MNLKRIFFVVAMLGGIVTLTACGLGKDEVTNTNYKVTVEDAANIYKKNMSICLLTRLKKYI